MRATCNLAILSVLQYFQATPRGQLPKPEGQCLPQRSYIAAVRATECVQTEQLDDFRTINSLAGIQHMAMLYSQKHACWLYTHVLLLQRQQV